MANRCVGDTLAWSRLFSRSWYRCRKDHALRYAAMHLFVESDQIIIVISPLNALEEGYQDPGEVFSFRSQLDGNIYVGLKKGDSLRLPSMGILIIIRFTRS